jgi:hypothetical protein
MSAFLGLWRHLRRKVKEVKADAQRANRRFQLSPSAFTSVTTMSR